MNLEFKAAHRKTASRKAASHKSSGKKASRGKVKAATPVPLKAANKITAHNSNSVLTVFTVAVLNIITSSYTYSWFRYVCWICCCSRTRQANSKKRRGKSLKSRNGAAIVEPERSKAGCTLDLYA